MSEAMKRVQAERNRVVVTPRRFFYGAIIALLCALFMGGTSIQYANYVDRKSNQRWCGIVRTLDDAYRNTPPQSPTGRVFAEEMAKLRKDFGCG